MLSHAGQLGDYLWERHLREIEASYTWYRLELCCRRGNAHWGRGVSDEQYTGVSEGAYWVSTNSIGHASQSVRAADPLRP